MEMEKVNVLTEEEKEQRRKERRKRRKYRLLILLLLLLGTGVMLGTSTYAWFTANKNVSVGTLTVNINAKNGIQISADGTNWKSVVSTADLSGAKAGAYGTAVNQLPSTLEPVSTVKAVNSNGKLDMYYGVVDTSETETNNGEYILITNDGSGTDTAETEVNGTTGKFIAFDIFLKVNAGTDIALTAGSGVTSTDDNDKGIKNASRVAFIVLGNKADGTALSEIQGLNGGAASPVYFWEPNYDVHTSAGVAAANDTYGITTTQTGGSALTYTGIKAVIPTSADILLGNCSSDNTKNCQTTFDTNYFATVEPNYKTTEDFAADQQIFSLNAGITKIRVYMWVEGQDVDCENNASGGNIDFDLKINVVESGT